MQEEALFLITPTAVTPTSCREDITKACDHVEALLRGHIYPHKIQFVLTNVIIGEITVRCNNQTAHIIQHCAHVGTVVKKPFI